MVTSYDCIVCMIVCVPMVGIEECEGGSCQYWSEAACDAVSGTVAKQAVPAAKSPHGMFVAICQPACPLLGLQYLT